MTYAQRLEGGRPEERLEPRAEPARPRTSPSPKVAAAASVAGPPRAARGRARPPPRPPAPRRAVPSRSRSAPSRTGRARSPSSTRLKGKGFAAYVVTPEGEGLFNVRVGNFADPRRSREGPGAPARRREVQAVHREAVSRRARSPGPAPAAGVGAEGQPSRSRGPGAARPPPGGAAGHRLRGGALSQPRRVLLARAPRPSCSSGDRCTRRCGYCSVATGPPAARPTRGARAGGGGRGPPEASATSC